jgi:pyruvate-formate lyase-activating enzyme
VLKEIHILLTYGCTFECKHCFLYCSPRSEGTFTRDRIAVVLDQAKEIGSVGWIYFEGGEPFLYYALMVEGIRMARNMGFKTGIVTNGYWATSVEDAEVWLRPLVELEVADLSMSDDEFHGSDGEAAPVKAAIAAADKLGLTVNIIRVDKPTPGSDADATGRKGAAIEGGPVRFRGRAVDRLSDGVARRPGSTYTECPFEDLQSPERIHVDAFGNVHFCQGLSIGNMWEKPLSRLLNEFDAHSHPICGPLVEGGPAHLARSCGVPSEEGYMDACHLCFLTRRSLIDRFPEYLAPRQVYGLE